jgi:hypothetical protein
MLKANQLWGDFDIENPSEEDIENAIRTLVETKDRILTIHLNDAVTYMDVAGGEDRKYIIFIMNSHYVHLVNMLASREKQVELEVCGQIDEWPEHKVIDFETTLQAALYFARTGERDPSLDWELDWE